MDISLFDWAAFLAAIVYLLLLPGANIIRTLGWAQKKQYAPVELLVVAFGISLCILILVSLALALPYSIGLNFYTLIGLETLVIIASTKEVVGFARKALKR